jgi:hypothetical protein
MSAQYQEQTSKYLSIVLYFRIGFIDTEETTRTINTQSAVASIKEAEPRLGGKELSKRVAAALGIDLKVFKSRKLVSLTRPPSPASLPLSFTRQSTPTRLKTHTQPLLALILSQEAHLVLLWLISFHSTGACRLIILSQRAGFPIGDQLKGICSLFLCSLFSAWGRNP